jgi:hypothetical protein
MDGIILTAIIIISSLLYYQYYHNDVGLNGSLEVTVTFSGFLMEHW